MANNKNDKRGPLNTRKKLFEARSAQLKSLAEKQFSEEREKENKLNNRERMFTNNNIILSVQKRKNCQKGWQKKYVK